MLFNMHTYTNKGKGRRTQALLLKNMLTHTQGERGGMLILLKGCYNY